MNMKSSEEINLEIHREPGQYRVRIPIELEIFLPVLEISEVIDRFFEVFKKSALKCAGEFLSRLDDLMVLGEGGKSVKGRKICKILDESLKTPWGKVPFRCRQVLRDGVHSVPLRKVIGLGSGKQIVDGAFSEELSRCLFASFEKSWKMSERVISRGKLWSMFQEASIKKREEHEKAIGFFSEGDISEAAPAGDIACSMIDDIWVRCRLSEAEREKREKEGKRKSGWLRVKTASTKVKNSGDEGWSRPLVYASCSSPDEYLGEARDFFNCHLGLHNIPNFFCISDGDSLGKKFTECHPDGIWLLDWWHLWEHTKKITTIDKGLRREVWELLKSEKFDEVFAILRGLSSEMKIHIGNDGDKGTDSEKKYLKKIKKAEKSWLVKRLKDVESLITYIENQRAGIENYRKLLNFLPAEDLIFGNGPIERKQGTMLGYRMKGQGKSWSKKWAPNMVFQLNALNNNGSEKERLSQLLAQLEELEEMEKLKIPPPASCKKTNPPKGCRGNLPAYRRGKKDSAIYQILRSVENGGQILKTA